MFTDKEYVNLAEAIKVTTLKNSHITFINHEDNRILHDCIDYPQVITKLKHKEK